MARDVRCLVIRSAVVGDGRVWRVRCNLPGCSREVLRMWRHDLALRAGLSHLRYHGFPQRQGPEKNGAPK